jgi:hypothetical protein
MLFSDIHDVGIGLRAQHYAEILATKPSISWFEVLIDNYMEDGGLPLYHLTQVRQDYPITFHGVGLSLGSTDPLDTTYLHKLKTLIERFEPAWISDHLSWSQVHGHVANDLLPLPYTEESVSHLADRIQQVQEVLGRRILVENVSSYVGFTIDAMPEWAFVREIVTRADCLLLLDVNNFYVSAINHDFNPRDYLAAIPAERVREIHLAGYEDKGAYLLDTHGQRVHAPVWQLYRDTLACVGPQPTLIEWDTDIPAWSVLRDEADQAQRILQEYSHARAA